MSETRPADDWTLAHIIRACPANLLLTENTRRRMAVRLRWAKRLHTPYCRSVKRLKELAELADVANREWKNVAQMTEVLKAATAADDTEAVEDCRKMINTHFLAALAVKQQSERIIKELHEGDPCF